MEFSFDNNEQRFLHASKEERIKNARVDFKRTLSSCGVVNTTCMKLHAIRQLSTFPSQALARARPQSGQCRLPQGE